MYKTVIKLLSSSTDVLPMMLDNVECDLPYLLKKTPSRDYLIDPWTWKQGPKKKLDGGNLDATYYYLRVDAQGTRIAVNSFRKIVYSQSASCNVVVVYTGDISLAKSLPHGNSKSEKMFKRTAKSTILRLKEDTVGRSVLTSYNTAVLDIQDSTPTSLTYEQRNKFDDHCLPRDSKQVENHRYLSRNKDRITPDNLINVYAMGLSVLREHIHFYRMLPDIMVIAGNKGAFSLVNRLIKQSDMGKWRLNQQLSYDTTFNLTEHCVSILTARNTEIEGDPIFPVAFMVHERKHTDVHDYFWSNFLNNKIQFNSAVPIVTDREKAIIKAIKSSNHSHQLLFCHNHIIQDVKRWLSANNLAAKYYTQLRYDIETLLKCTTYDEFDALSLELSKSFPEKFKSYYNSELYADMRAHAIARNYLKYDIFTNLNQRPTTNISESVNNMIKSYQERKEQPIDKLIVDLLQFQLAILYEFNRAIRQTGNFTVKKSFERRRKSVYSTATSVK